MNTKTVAKIVLLLAIVLQVVNLFEIMFLTGADVYWLKVKIVFTLGMMIISRFFFFRKEKDQTAITQKITPTVLTDPFELTFAYAPDVDADGKFISLHEKDGKVWTYDNLPDLQRSVKSSLKKDPSLIEKEIEIGRLIAK